MGASLLQYFVAELRVAVSEIIWSKPCTPYLIRPLATAKISLAGVCLFLQIHLGATHNYEQVSFRFFV